MGVLKDQHTVKDTKAKITGKAAVTKEVYTFTFTAIDQRCTVPNWKIWYMDLNNFGRHFLIYSEKDPKVKRHYTICCTMQPQILRAIKALADAVLKGQEIAFPDDLFLLNEDSHSVVMTLKKYKDGKMGNKLNDAQKELVDSPRVK